MLYERRNNMGLSKKAREYLKNRRKEFETERCLLNVSKEREVIHESIVNLDILSDMKIKRTERKGKTSGAIFLYNSAIELI
jgi:hypothetical protein